MSASRPVGPKNATRTTAAPMSSACPIADGDDHHHVRTGRQLADAIKMDELMEVEPLVDVDGEDLHLREGSHATADGQEREVGEDADQCGNLVHCAPPSAWRFTRIVEEDRRQADEDQRLRHAEMEAIDRQHGDEHEHQVKLMRQRFLAELNDRGQKQSGGGGGNALQDGGDEAVVAVHAIDHADDQHDHCARQTYAHNAGDGAHPALQPVAQQNGHVGGIQAGKALADRREARRIPCRRPNGSW